MIQKNRFYLLFFLLGIQTLVSAQTLFQADDAARKRLIDIAMKYRGIPYIYGAESPSAFDCSGFVRYVYREAFGLELPRSSRDYPASGFPVDWKKANIGDVFIYDTVGGKPSHVSIFAGNGQVIHAVSSGPKTGVIITPVSDKYWSARLIAARSYLAAAPAGSAAKQEASPVSAARTGSSGAGKTPPAAGQPGPAVSGKLAGDKAAETVISDLGIEIPAKKTSETDRIPTAAGTSLAFTLTNASGKDSGFTVLFFRVNPKNYKLEPIYEERIKMKMKESFGLPPYRFDEEGKYKLVVKDSWGNQLVDREFMVKE